MHVPLTAAEGAPFVALIRATDELLPNLKTKNRSLYVAGMWLISPLPNESGMSIEISFRAARRREAQSFLARRFPFLKIRYLTIQKELRARS